MYTKKYYNDCFNIISNRKANIIGKHCNTFFVCRQHSANTHLYNLNESLNE